MIKKKTIKLFGVPGSGKTTECMKKIKQFIDKENYSIEDIGFTTFTLSGIRSIKTKLENEKNFFFPEENYFKTMHSLCWKLLELKKENIMTKKMKKEFFEEREIKFEENEVNGLEEKELGKKIIEFHEYIQNRLSIKCSKTNKTQIKNLALEFFKDDEEIGAIEIDLITETIKELAKYKEEKGLYLYSDCLIELLEQKIDIPVKILIVDEAQDLFPLQMKIIDLWTKEYDKDYFIISGDDFQCVHEWSGGKPEYLIEYTNNNMEKIIKNKSYRLPKNIANLCNDISKKIKYGEKKKIISNNENGEIKYLNTISINEITKKINLNYDNYFLFRTNKIKNEVADILFRETDIPYSFIDGKNTKYSLKFLLVNNAIQKLSKKQDITFEEACKLIEVIETPFLQRGVKNNFKKRNDLEKISAENFFKLCKSTLIYHSKKNGSDLKEYLLKLINYTKSKKHINLVYNDLIKSKIKSSGIIKYKKKGKTIELPLQLGTFHNSKGLEAHNVFVFLGTNTYFSEMNDSEYRCFYVACSRAIKNLYFISFFFGGGKAFLETEMSEIIRKHSAFD